MGASHPRSSAWAERHMSKGGCLPSTLRKRALNAGSSLLHCIADDTGPVPFPDCGWNGYITRHSPSPQPRAPTHMGERGGGGLKKEKRGPKGRIAQCRGVECEKGGNAITMNCLSCLLSELFLTCATGAPQGAPQGCSPQSLQLPVSHCRAVVWAKDTCRTRG